MCKQEILYVSLGFVDYMITSKTKKRKFSYKPTKSWTIYSSVLAECEGFTSGHPYLHVISCNYAYYQC